MMDIWRENVPVRFGSIDRSDRLTLDSIFSLFQEAAICHATALGVGRNAMAQAGRAWILSRFSLFVQRRPMYEEIIEVSTWPRRWEKLFALRDYEIRDARNISVARGRGGWLVVDLEKRRPLRAQTIMETMPPNEGINALLSGPAGLQARENLSKKMERTALYSDIDYIGHANNARYIQWIQDVTDMEILTNANQIRFDINYLNEVLPGETVELWTAPLVDAGNTAESAAASAHEEYPRSTGAAFAYEGRRLGSDKAVFRAELRSGG
ncbi:MAG: thioesterase [Treponema sp.]|nr:thioesterase [Treponema sp.]